MKKMLLIYDDDVKKVLDKLKEDYEEKIGRSLKWEDFIFIKCNNGVQYAKD